MRNIAKIRNTFPFSAPSPPSPHILFFLLGLTFLLSSPPLPPQHCGGMGNKILINPLHVVSVTSFLFWLFLWSPTGDSPPWTPAKWIFGAAFLPELLQARSLPWGASPSRAACSKTGPSRVHNPCKLSPVWAVLCCSHVLSFLSASCCCAAVFSLFLLQYPRGLQGWWAQPWPGAGLSWSQLELALLYMGKAYCSFSQRPPL